MLKLFFATCLTTILLCGCELQAAAPAVPLQAPKMPTSCPVVIPGLTIRCCRLGAQNVTIVIAKGEFQDNARPSGIGLEGSFWYDAVWRQFSKEIELHWKCQISPELTGAIEFEPWPGEFWPDEAFDMRARKFDLAKGNVFVVTQKALLESPNAVRVRRRERVQVGLPVDPKTRALNRVDVTQLVRPWRDLSVEQLTEALAHDEVIRSFTATIVESPILQQTDHSRALDADTPP